MEDVYSKPQGSEALMNPLPSGKRKPGRPRLSEQPPEGMETRRQIIEDAKKLFMQRGYSAISISHIVEAVGVTKPTLYYYYPDKEHLYAAVLVDMIHAGEPYYKGILSSPGTVSDRIRRIVKGYLKFCPTSINLLLRDAVEYLGPATSPMVTEAYVTHLFDPFKSMFEEGIESGELRTDLEPGVITMMFLSQLDSYHIWEQLQNHHQANMPNAQVLPMDTLINHFCDIFLSGIRSGIRE